MGSNPLCNCIVRMIPKCPRLFISGFSTNDNNHDVGGGGGKMNRGSNGKLTLREVCVIKLLLL